jgi:peptidylprolyl isomerase
MTHPLARTATWLLAFPLLLAAQTPAPKTTKAPAMITTDSGLKYVDTLAGTGAAPLRGQKCLVHYTGWLNDGRGGRGKKFDSSLDRKEPLAFPVGIGRVIKGWDEGLLLF